MFIGTQFMYVGSGVMRGEGWLALLLVTMEREGLASSLEGVGVDQGWAGVPSWEEDGATR